MRFLILASMGSFGLAAPQNSFFVLTRGSGAQESTSYIDYSAGLRNSAIPASPKVIRPTTDSALAYMKSDKDAAGDASLAYLAAIAENPEPSAACKESATAYI